MKTLSRNNTPSRQETSRANLRTSAGESTKLAAEGRMIDRTARATAAYAQAKDFSDRHFPAEVIWQRTVSMDGVTESAFLREAAWVILCTGFRERTLRTRFGYLSLCFCDWGKRRGDRRECRGLPGNGSRRVQSPSKGRCHHPDRKTSGPRGIHNTQAEDPVSTYRSAENAPLHRADHGVPPCEEPRPTRCKTRSAPASVAT